ncbi:hypothetical protein FJY93_01030 [Candidatus Kaiserbacteria bacterium]|nr:hypothetical protein [Candidatus Kaiserbacteria bacterium]
MYQKYCTEAIVLSMRESGESDQALALLTRDFGLVWARAGAMRREYSKMRYSLQLYAHASVSLVRGKANWRAAGASCSTPALRGESLRAFARIAHLVVRLVVGEERSDYLFEAVLQAHASLLHAGDEMIPTIEIVAVARILFALGYISAEALETTLFAHTAYSFDHLHEAEMIRDNLLISINRALAETHL